MSTVLRGAGFRVVIYPNDHAPAHVHLVGSGEAKINLLGAGGHPHLVWATGMSMGDIRKGMQLVTDHQETLLEAWGRLHGRPF